MNEIALSWMTPEFGFHAIHTTFLGLQSDHGPSDRSVLKDSFAFGSTIQLNFLVPVREGSRAG